MANVVKYSLTSQANSLKKGNVVLGMNSIEYGPTSATGFWNGIEVPPGGYVMYIPYSNGTGVSIYSINNDTELIKIVNEIGLQNYTTAAEALAWTGQQTGLMLVNRAADNVITDGLVLALDAGFRASYPATGATWYNLGSGAYNGTLANGPSYSNGILTFDAANDWLALDGLNLGGTSYTFDILIGNVQNNQNYIYDSNNPRVVLGVSPDGAGNPGYEKISYYDGGWKEFGIYPIGDNRFHRITWCINGTSATAYLDGVQSGTTLSVSSNNLSAPTAPTMMNRYSKTIPKSGKLGKVFFYNRSLSASEVLHNYYQSPIVTDGLIFAVDAGNLVSYESGQGTTINDLTSHNNDATLINGASFTDTGIPRFQLDGVDDTISVPKDLSGFEHNIQYDIDWTIECWMYMYPHDGLPQHYTSIYGNYNGCNYTVYKGNAQGIVIYFTAVPASTTVNFSFGPRNNASGSQCPDVSVNWSNAESGWVAANTNKWCHFIMTSDDGTNYKIYVNGIQQGSTKTVDFKNSQNRIDNNLTSTSNYRWGGSGVTAFKQVDFSCMRIYNRPLSSSEILQNFNAQRAIFGI